MRILMVSQWFTPEGTVKGAAFAKALVQRGYQVQVLTGFPNYPGGKIYEGYRIKLLQRETLEGIPIIRVPLYPSHDNSAFRRVCNYLSFALAAAFIGCPLVDKADVMYVYHPPATVALPALLISWIRRIPIVYDIQDLWPDTLLATNMVRNATVLNIVGKWCQMTYRHVRKIVVLSPGFKETLLNRGVPSEKIEIIYNWCNEQDIVKMDRNNELAQELGMRGKFNVVFAGTMGKAQGLETVIAAAGILQTKVPWAQFVLVGDGVECEHLKRMTEQKGLTNVIFLPRRAPSAIAEVLNLADVLLVHLRKDPLFLITIPSKIQAYMAVGRPILVGVEGDAANRVLKAGAGIAYDPGSSELLAQSIEKLTGMSTASLDEMGERGRQFYVNELAFERGVDKFDRIFRQVVSDRHNSQKLVGL